MLLEFKILAFFFFPKQKRYLNGKSLIQSYALHSRHHTMIGKPSVSDINEK